MAVFLNASSLDRPGRTPGAGPSGAGWRWTERDAEAIASWAEPLRARGIVSDLFVVSDLLKTGRGVREARLAAARCGAEAVLFVEGVSQVDAHLNALSVLNLLVLPGFLVPASHRDALLCMRGALYDVGNEYLYLTVDAEGEGGVVRPTFRVRDEEAIRIAREWALEGFGRELARRLAALKGA